VDISATLGMQTTFKYASHSGDTSHRSNASKGRNTSSSRISGIAGTPPTAKNQVITKKLASEKIRNKGALQQ